MIEKVQMRATKFVPGISRLDYEERVKTIDIMKLKDRRIRGDLIKKFKIHKLKVFGNFDENL